MRVSVTQRLREVLLKKVLEGHGAQKTLECSCADGGEPAVGGCRVGTSMRHGPTNFHARGESILNEPPCLPHQNAGQFPRGLSVALLLVDGGRELAPETSRHPKHLLGRFHGHHEADRAKVFLIQNPTVLHESFSVRAEEHG